MLNWEQVDPGRTERGIQMLLRRRFPGLRSLDGAGGDGGRDAHLITADGRTVFEIKSFRRLRASQRRQIQRSLTAAVKSAADMNRWVLVIPMNMTPTRPGVRSSEETWFDDVLPKLARQVDLAWWGLDWLDAQVAENMDIQRYIEGTDGQLLQRAAEFKLENALLTGGDRDLRSRVDNLTRRVAEVSPFWTLDFSSQGGILQTALRAKVDDAHILDPITITPTFAFRTDDPEDEALRRRFERALAFGGAVELPAGYVTRVEIEASDEARLLLYQGDPTTSEFIISRARERLERPVRCNFQVLSEDDRVLDQFPVYVRERTTGSRGATLFGSDPAHIAAFEVDVPRPSTENLHPGETLTMEDARLHIDMPESIVGYDIASLLPVLKTLAAATQGTHVRFELPGLGYIGGRALEADPFPGARETHQVVADLHRMGQLTGSVLRFPANITNGQVARLRDAVRRLDGEEVEFEGGLTISLRPEAVGEFLDTLKKAPQTETAGGFLAAAHNWPVEVGDLTLPYGPVALWAPHPRLNNLDELEAIAANGCTAETDVQALLEPTDTAFRWVSRQQAGTYLASSTPPTESAS